eukprot:2618789-Ditylum_brightwellii.AAC.1
MYKARPTSPQHLMQFHLRSIGHSMPRTIKLIQEEPAAEYTLTAPSSDGNKTNFNALNPDKEKVCFQAAVVSDDELDKNDTREEESDEELRNAFTLRQSKQHAATTINSPDGHTVS